MENVLDWKAIQNLSNRSLAICAHLHRICKEGGTFDLTPAQEHALEQLTSSVRKHFETSSLIAHSLDRATVAHKHLFSVDTELRKELDTLQKQISKRGGATWPQLSPSLTAEAKNVSLRLRDGSFSANDGLARLHQRVKERATNPSPELVKEHMSIALVDSSAAEDFRTYTLKLYGVLQELHHKLKRDDHWDDEIRKRFERSYSIFGEQAGRVDLKDKIAAFESNY